MAAQGSLQTVPSGKNVMVVAMQVEQDERMRLESMGIIPGTELGVLSNSGGPLLVSVGDTRVIVEKNLAQNLIVA